MFKLCSTLVVAGACALAGIDTVRACGDCGSAAPAPATVQAPRSSTATAQNGRQGNRRYSVSPGGTTYRTPSMIYGRRSSGGLSWSASRKVLGL